MTISTTSSIDANAYPYECSCGERFSSIAAADHCRKCRNYCVFGYCTHVVDVRDNSIVAGEEPSQEEYELAVIRYDDRLADEKREFEAWKAEADAEHQHFIIEQDRAAAEDEEDSLWDIQDSFMK